MRAVEAEIFSGYGGLRQIELPKPQPAGERVLVRVTAAGVTPLDHTILSGGHPRAKAPLVLGNEGAGVIEDAGDSALAPDTRVLVTGSYGVRENGTWQEWLLAMAEDLAVVPDPIDDVVAASLPVAYLTAQITLTLAGFKAAHTVLAPAIGGSVGNATYQVARAQGAGTVISTAGSAAKARARELGFEDVIDLTTEGLADGVRRITAGKRVDIVIDSIGGTVTGEALSSLGLDGVLITLGYSAGRKTTIDLTDLIWKRARMAGFSMFAQSPTLPTRGARGRAARARSVPRRAEASRRRHGFRHQRQEMRLLRMRPWLKRTLQITGGVVLVVAAGFGGLVYSIVGGNTEITDGATPAPDVRIIKDGIVDFGVVDVGEGHVILIDAGNDPTGLPLLAELARRKVGPDAVTAIFFTHGHPDHIAGASLCPNASLYALDADVALVEGREGSHGPLTGMIGAKPTGLHVHGLKDGAVTTVGTKSIRVIATPGHTGGSAAYLVSGVLFLGDSAAMKTDGKLAAPPWALSDDLAKDRASLVALGKMLESEKAAVVAIVPGHTGTGQFRDLAAFTP